MYEELIGELHIVASGVQSKRRRELLEKAADAIEDLSREYESIAKDLNGAVELVRNLQRPRWIPVTERLPEDMWGNVLVTDGKNVGMGWLDYYTRKDTGAVERDWFAPNTPVEENKITHWMPLPEPPKEETE